MRPLVALCCSALLLVRCEKRDIPVCEVNDCHDAYADCFTLKSTKCCVCPPGFVGGGREICTAKDSPDRFLRLRGTLTIRLSPDTYPETFDISHETLNANGPPLGQTAVYGVRATGRIHRTLNLLVPIFQHLNALTATPMENARAYSIYTLTGGFFRPVRITFNCSLVNHGTMLVDVNIARRSSDAEYFQGSITVNVRTEGDFRLPDEVLSQMGSPSVVEYHKIARGMLRFEKRRVAMANKRGTLTTMMTIWGAVYATMDGSSCLLEDESFVEETDAFYVHMEPSSFCSTRCVHGGGGCTFYCIGYPRLSSRNELYTEPEGRRFPRPVDEGLLLEEDDED